MANNAKKDGKILGIVAKVMAMFELGEEGKVGAVYNRLVKNWERELTVHEHSKKSAQFSYESAMLKANDVLVEKTEAIDEIWNSITPDKASEVRNTAFEDFQSSFEARLDRALRAIDDATDSIEVIEAAHKASSEAADAQIDMIKARIAKAING
tara:strand:- start:8862 stop:9323 length:462 start_codon:yes stop_codon:yes gene_type:complete